MGALNVNVTYVDIEKRMRTFDLSNVEGDIDDAIELETALVEVLVLQVGIKDPSLITTTKHRLLYITCRAIVMFNVTAEVMLDFNQEYHKAGKRREDRARKLEQDIISMPEVLIDDWHETTHMGTASYAAWSEGINSLQGSGYIDCIPWADMRGA